VPGPAPLAAGLSAVEAHLRSLTAHEDPVIEEGSRHLLLSGGKRFRPLVALTTARLGRFRPAVVEVAAAVELLHVSSLYHDDVIDEAATRRGAPAVHVRWGRRRAVTVGDRLTALALAAAARAERAAAGILASTYGRLVAGQTAELRLLGSLDHAIDDYYGVVDGKTTSLIRASAVLGARAAGAAAADVDAVDAWATEAGRAFQLADDILDLVGDPARIGKPVGTDLTEGVFTLPVLATAAGPNGPELRALLAGRPPYPGAATEAARALVLAGGAVEDARRRLVGHLARSERALARLPSPDVAGELARLGRSVVEAAAT